MTARVFPLVALLLLLTLLPARAQETPDLPGGGELRLAEKGEVSLTVPLKELRNAQDRIRFRMDAGRKNAASTLTVTLLIRRQGETREVSARAVDARGSMPLDLPLNSAFQLQDATYEVPALRFTLRGGGAATVRIGELRLGSNDELTAAQKEFTVASAYRPPQPRSVAGVRPVKVWFEFDNTDRDDTVRAWPSRNRLPDPNPSGGFGALLLEHADGIAEAAASPEEADVIVYSRARAGAPPRLAKLVGAGKRLIVYGPCPDPELAALLPLEFAPRTLSGFAPRERASAVRAGHPVLRGTTLADTDYGRYFATRKRAGETVIAFACGEPLLVESGNILHFATGAGSALLPPDGVFFDRALLRAVCARDPRALDALEHRAAEERGAAAAKDSRLLADILGGRDRSGFRVGMSENNFGRFGWLVGEGLLCGGIGRDLTVENGPQYYRFDDSGRIAAGFHNWKHKVVSGRAKFPKSTPDNTDPLEQWSGSGTVEYTAETVFNPDWTGRPFFFEVEGGIDDTDETFFNGVRIGATGAETPRHWEARRAYPIPEKLIRRGEPNRITVRVTNLHGTAGFNSIPRLFSPAPGGDAPGTLLVAETDWVHKKYVITPAAGGEGRELELSLLSPFIRNRIPQPETNLALEEKTAQYAAWSTPAGIRVVRLEERPDFYDRKRDGEWNAPWLLLFRKNWERARPLLLVFGKPVESLRASLNGRFVSGIRIRSNGPIGTVMTGWPWGSTPVNASKWTAGLPEEALRQIRRSLDLALEFPVGCDEAYRIDRKKGEIEIVNRFRYRRIDDAWKTPARRTAVLPPLIGLARETAQYVKKTDPVEFLGVNTDYGPLQGAAGTDRISYTLPLPPEEDFVPADVKTDPGLHRELNSLFTDGVRFSRGGGVRREEFTPAYPEGEKRYPEVIGIPLFTWNFGLSMAVQGYFVLTPENRLLLRDRIRDRFLLPLEQYQYKYLYRNRQEPFTGLRYPILFNHSHPNSTRYAPGIGSPVIFGDNNEGCTMLAWLGNQCADLLGAPEPMRNAWNFIRYGMRNALVLDDYAWHGSACREFGSGSYIDMLNGEYAGFVSLAKLARNAGDSAMEDEALYRAAKRAVPTLMRLRFPAYLERALPHIPLDGVALCTGFAENAIPLLRLPTANRNFSAANDLFDFSQGFPGTLHRLYVRYALPEVSGYLHRKAFPALFRENQYGPEYLTPMMLYADETVPVREKLDTLLRTRDRKLRSDWPGMKMNYQGGLWFWRTGGHVELADFRLLDFREAVYDPAAKTLRLAFDARPGARLGIRPAEGVRTVVRNGEPAAPRREGETLYLPVQPGNNEIEVTYR